MFSPRCPSPRNCATYKSSVFTDNENVAHFEGGARSPRQRTSDTYRTSELLRNNLRTETKSESGSAFSSNDVLRALQEGNRSNRAVSPSVLSRSGRDGVPPLSLIRDSLFSDKKSARKMSDTGRKSPVPEKRPDWEDVMQTSPRGARGRQSPSMRHQRPMSPRGEPPHRSKQPHWEGFHSPRGAPSDTLRSSAGDRKLRSPQPTDLGDEQLEPLQPVEVALPIANGSDVPQRRSASKDRPTEATPDKQKDRAANQTDSTPAPSEPAPTANEDTSSTGGRPDMGRPSDIPRRESITGCSRKPHEPLPRNPLLYEPARKPLRQQGVTQVNSSSPRLMEQAVGGPEFTGIFPGVATTHLPVKQFQLLPGDAPPAELPHQTSEGFKIANGHSEARGSRTVPTPPPAGQVETKHRDAAGWKHRWQPEFSALAELPHCQSDGAASAFKGDREPPGDRLVQSQKELPHVSSAGVIQQAFSGTNVVPALSTSRSMLAIQSVGGSSTPIHGKGLSASTSLLAVERLSSSSSITQEPLYSVNELKRGAIHPIEFHSYLSESERQRRITLPCKLRYAPDVIKNAPAISAMEALPNERGGGYPTTTSSSPVPSIKGFPIGSKTTQVSLQNQIGGSSRKPFTVPGIARLDAIRQTQQMNSPRRIPVANQAMATLGGTPRAALAAGPGS
eukprot:gnl/MRDRNA2_/MRDRNA2_35055_c0_seq1.p1 gnl/MRDRNA2_/MRDRNA2_35055_c0~~gnl/MRDRNA2_/MRDRNA2_35055_c0_seq1.p1  ORF type:complete len:675 (-),score=93.87 gnl/MRDRNA2_/MRDRNA2_35055_c0_seq1:3-2027(-)